MGLLLSTKRKRQNLICKIANLGVDVPELGDLPRRCKPYEADVPVDITLDVTQIRPDTWKEASAESNYYLSSGFDFYRQLLRHDGMMLHASAVVVDGYAYLFSGPCGMGKSTHTAMYKKTFPDAVIINDDKPALRRIDGTWYAFGTPWCGKDGINVNTSAPLGGICFLHRGDTLLRRITALEAVPQFLKQTGGRNNAQNAQLLLTLLDDLLRNVPVFEFFNHAAPGNEQITYRAMREAIGRKEKTL